MTDPRPFNSSREADPTKEEGLADLVAAVVVEEEITLRVVVVGYIGDGLTRIVLPNTVVLHPVLDDVVATMGASQVVIPDEEREAVTGAAAGGGTSHVAA